MRDRQTLDRAAHRFRDDQAAFQCGFGQQRHELFAAVAPEEITRAPQACRRSRGDGTQALIAGAMSVRVVVEFEMVDVEHHHRERAAVAPRARPFARKRDVERAPVGDRRERVGQREAFELFGAHAALLVVQARAEVHRARFQERHVVGIERPRRRHGQIAEDDARERHRDVRRGAFGVLLAVLVRARLSVFYGVPDANARVERFRKQDA